MNERTWRIVTPEAVALDLEAAGLASRVGAELLDLFVLQVVFGAIATVDRAAGRRVRRRPTPWWSPW